MKTHDEDIFEHNGHRFRVRYRDDEFSGYPWENEDGHGPVRKSCRPHGRAGDKRAGERPLNCPGRNEYQFYYDWQAACRLARRDGWNAVPYDAPNRVARAVQADFDFLRKFVNGDWGYVGVIVDLLGENDEELDSADLWCVETYEDYHMEVAYQLADELISRHSRRLEETSFPVSTTGV